MFTTDDTSCQIDDILVYEASLRLYSQEQSYD
jgi:hypothetical protein